MVVWAVEPRWRCCVSLDTPQWTGPKKGDVCPVFNCHEFECTPWKKILVTKRKSACPYLWRNYLASLSVLATISLFHLLCNCLFSPVKESGDGWTDWASLQTIFSKPSGTCAEVWLAKETEEHHEELAAALVCAAWGSALLLQGWRGNETSGMARELQEFMVWLLCDHSCALIDSSFQMFSVLTKDIHT